MTDVERRFEPEARNVERFDALFNEVYRRCSPPSRPSSGDWRSCAPSRPTLRAGIMGRNVQMSGKVTVLGAGAMGSALATPFCAAGWEVNLWGTWLDDHLLEACAAGRLGTLCEMVGGRAGNAIGLAGVGDLDVTGLSGRNKVYGARIGGGEPASDALQDMIAAEQTVEGVTAARLAKDLADQRDPSAWRSLPLLARYSAPSTTIRTRSAGSSTRYCRRPARPRAPESRRPVHRAARPRRCCRPGAAPGRPAAPGRAGGVRRPAHGGPALAGRHGRRPGTPRLLVGRRRGCCSPGWRGSPAMHPVPTVLIRAARASCPAAALPCAATVARRSARP